MIAQFLAWIDGKKTYLSAIALVVYSWIGVYLGTVDQATAIDVTLGAAGLGGLRHAIEKNAPN